MSLEHSDQFESSEISIGINAHLLSPESGYRRAGIHQYIVQVLRHLPLLNDRSHYTVYTRDRQAIGERSGMVIVSSSWPTERRSMRILWEQSAWPIMATRERFDLLHSMAFVTPVVGKIPTIVTVYDLSFVHFPEKFPALQRFYFLRNRARFIFINLLQQHGRLFFRPFIWPHYFNNFHRVWSWRSFKFLYGWLFF